MYKDLKILTTQLISSGELVFSLEAVVVAAVVVVVVVVVVTGVVESWFPDGFD